MTQPGETASVIRVTEELDRIWGQLCELFDQTASSDVGAAISFGHFCRQFAEARQDLERDFLVMKVYMDNRK